jgi:hypothetical protein
VISQPVTELSFRSATKRPGVCILDGRFVAFLTEEYENAQVYTRIQVLDLYTDTVTADDRLGGNYVAMENQVAIGYLVLKTDDGLVHVLDRDLNTCAQFTPDNYAGVLTDDLSRYFYIWGDDLYCLELASGESSQTALAFGMPLEAVRGYDPEGEILLLSGFLGPYTTEICFGAVDLESMTLLALQGEVSGGSLTSDGFFLENMVEGDPDGDLHYGTWNGSILEVPNFLLRDTEHNIWHIPGSDCIWAMDFENGLESKPTGSRIYVLGDAIGAYDMMELTGGANINFTYALPGGNVMALEVTRRGYRPYLVAPELLELEMLEASTLSEKQFMDDAVKEEYGKELELQQLSEEFDQVRATADRLEEQYGVTVLLSKQCTTPVSLCSMVITTTDQAELEDEVGLIAKALEDLEEALALYPVGFFHQFRNDARQRGLVVMLVEDFADARNVIGVCFEMGEWYPIAVDITSGQVLSTYAHEIWHATENKIKKVDPSKVGDKLWDTLNPPGYAYSYDETPDYIYDTRMTFFGGKPSDEIYFVDAYGKTMPQEDRARIMEYVMTSSQYGSQIAKEPHLNAKLKAMAVAIRAAFDTEGWENIPWERYLNMEG